MKVANCGHDENGHYTGGTPGDQTGDEWNVVQYYVPTYGWSYHFSWINNELGELFASLAVKAANNNNIGYCQGHRGSFEKELKKAGWDPSAITTPCEADCSSGVIALIHAVGNLRKIKELKEFKASYTGNLHTELIKCKKFFKATTSSRCGIGGINVTPGRHTNIIVDVDETIKDDKEEICRKQPARFRDKSKSGAYKVVTNGGKLSVRCGAGIGYREVASMKNGSTLTSYGYYNMVGSKIWLYVVTSGGTVGYVSSDWVQKVE